MKEMAHKTSVDFLKNAVLRPQPVSWLLHAKAFRYSGINLVEKYEQLCTHDKKAISTIEIFNRSHTYKVAIYLLCHGFELLLKGIIAGCVLSANPITFSHSVLDMVDFLVKKGVIGINKDELETVKLIDIYLKWFGRYYCPKEKEIDKVINDAYTKPDEQNMVSFKHPLKYPTTHTKINMLFDDLWPPQATDAMLAIPSLTFYQ